MSCLSWNGVGEVRGGCGLLGLGQIDWLNWVLDMLVVIGLAWAVLLKKKQSL